MGQENIHRILLAFFVVHLMTITASMDIPGESKEEQGCGVLTLLGEVDTGERTGNSLSCTAQCLQQSY